MKRSISGGLILLLITLTFALADLDNNLIEDNEQVPQVPFAMNRGRLGFVRDCKPCGASECQLMGMQRYSEPRCEPLSGVGSPCRPFQEPENKTLHFPHAILHCNHVHMQFCPCASGLECDLETAQCRRVASARGRQMADFAGPSSSHTLDDSFGERQDDELPLPAAFEPMQAALPVGGKQNARGANRFAWAVARFY